MTINIRSFAFRDAEQATYQAARSVLEQLFPDLFFCYDDKGSDILYFVSGGSEREAIGALKPGRMYLLLAGKEGNSWAAATEVKAWADHQGISTILLSVEAPVAKQVIQMFTSVSRVFRSLNGKRAGLIGGVSHWLVASSFPPELAKERFGIIIESFPWELLPDYLSYAPDPAFLNAFKNHQPEKLVNEARVHHFLKGVIEKQQLDALTLECFTMVKKDDVTACLSLALLNSEGMAAACEGDLVSLVGMMLVQSLTGRVPWMANIASISDDQVLLAHCTAPLDSMSGFKVNTHFETDRSAAVQGKVFGNEVTVFRLGMGLDKAFIAAGNIVSRPQHAFACRTQVEVSLSAGEVEKLRHTPLGNHHLIIPGNVTALLQLACQYKNIRVV